MLLKKAIPQLIRAIILLHCVIVRLKFSKIHNINNTVGNPDNMESWQSFHRRHGSQSFSYPSQCVKEMHQRRILRTLMHMIYPTGSSPKTNIKRRRCRSKNSVRRYSGTPRTGKLMAVKKLKHPEKNMVKIGQL